ncbi:MAG: sugar ABC transporter substrate-binding protein [Actinobacteria bacterium]|nr:sugar ABC transporter substrate-binding protein [Actinomycetota bacterium]
MKNAIRVLLIGILVGSMLTGFTGCKVPTVAEKVTTETVAKETTTETVTTTTEKKELKGKLTVITWAAPTQEAIERMAVKMFMDAYPGVTVDLIVIPGDQYLTKFQTMVAAGTPPDLAHATIDWAFPWVKAGLVTPLDDVFKEYPELSDSTKFLTNVFDTWNFEGHKWGMPYGSVSNALYYNKDMFDKAGIPYPSEDPNKPWTWDDFVNAAQKLTQDTNNDGKIDQWGFTLNPWWWVWTHLIYSFGGKLTDDNNKPTKFLLDSPEAINALRFMQDTIYKYKITPTPDVAAALGAQPWEGNIAAMEVTGTWSNSWRKDIKDFKWDIASPPDNTGPSQIIVAAGSYLIMKSTKYPEAAKAFIRFYLTEQVQNLQAGSALYVPINKELWEPNTPWTGIPGMPEHLLVSAQLLEGKTYQGYILTEKFKQIQEQVWPEEIDKLVNNKQTPEETGKNLTERGNELLK